MNFRIVAFILLVLFCVRVGVAETNKLRVGLLPFVNVSGKRQLDVWCQAFPERLAIELADAMPPRMDVYFDKVLGQLTNNAWDGHKAISVKLAGKVARELRLQKIVSGSFKHDKNGWEVEIRIGEPGSEAKAQVQMFKDESTHDLLGSMVEKTCAALGVDPNPAYVEVRRRYRISNAAIDKVAALRKAEESGESEEKLIKGLREVLASEPGYISARTSLMRMLLKANRMEEALVEAQKLVEIAPGLCVGHLGVAICQTKENKQWEQATLEALRVHPGCPRAAAFLFPAWTSQGRWDELKPVAEKAHIARPDEAVTTAALAAALAGQGDRDTAWQLLSETGSIDDEENPNVHVTLLQAATAVMYVKGLSRELLWLQRHSATNERARYLVSQADATFRLFYFPGSSPTNPPPRLYSREALQADLANRLTPEERALAENPLLVTEQTVAEALTLTSGLTNPTCKATVLLAYVIEERFKTEQQATNSAKPVRLPVCHEYASRLVCLARSIGLPAWLVHVDLSNEEISGFHDRAAIQISEDQVMQFDPTMATVGSAKDNFRILDDVQAIAHHLLQGTNLARIRVAQKLDPEDLWTRTTVVGRLASLGLVQEAEELCKTLGPECTNQWGYCFSRARIEMQRSRPNTALEWLERADALSPNNVQVHLCLGEVYQELHQSAKSTEHMEKALRLGAFRSELSTRAGLELTMKYSHALTESRQTDEKELVGRASAGDLHAQVGLASRLFEMGQYDEGLKWLLQAAKQGNAIAQENYGRSLHGLKGASAAEEAVEWLRKSALQGYSPAYCLLATLIYEGKGVRKDEVEASMWAHLGSAAGDKDKCGVLKEMQLFVDPKAFAEGKKRADVMLSQQGK